jgi:hypothetical protein
MVQMHSYTSTLSEQVRNTFPCIANASTWEKTGMRTAIRFCWQSGVIALAAIIFAFVVPGIALCKVVPLASIASAIAITTLVAGRGLYLAGRSIEKRTPQCERRSLSSSEHFGNNRGIVVVPSDIANRPMAGEEH